jgi:hypothetical protein
MGVSFLIFILYLIELNTIGVKYYDASVVYIVTGHKFYFELLTILLFFV